MKNKVTTLALAALSVCCQLAHGAQETRTVAFEYYTDTGLLKKEIVEPGPTRFTPR